jgi:hypothetical protein
MIPGILTVEASPKFIGSKRLGISTIGMGQSLKNSIRPLPGRVTNCHLSPHKFLGSVWGGGCSNLTGLKLLLIACFLKISLSLGVRLVASTFIPNLSAAATNKLTDY